MSEPAIRLIRLKFDRFFRKREINTAYERITGYQREQVIGQAFALPHYDRDFTDQIKHTVLREGSWSGEVTDFKADGAELLLELTLDAVRNDSGEIKYKPTNKCVSVAASANWTPLLLNDCDGSGNQ